MMNLELPIGLGSSDPSQDKHACKKSRQPTHHIGLLALLGPDRLRKHLAIMAWGSGNILPHRPSRGKDIRGRANCSDFVTKSDNLWSVAVFGAYYSAVFGVP